MEQIQEQVIETVEQQPAAEGKKKLTANVKKIIVLCSMVALLVVTGVLNFVLNSSPNAPGLPDDPVAPTGYFATFRSQREAARAEILAELDLVISSEFSSEAEVANARQRRVQIVEQMQTELIIEGLIKANGFDDAVVTITQNNINIIVTSVEMDSTQAGQIFRIVTEQTDFRAPQVILTPFNNSR